MPAILHDFLTAYVRYATHVNAYVFLAARRYPGFRGRPGYEVDVEIDRRHGRAGGAAGSG